MAFVVFDLLQLDGREVMGEPWADRRKRLQDVGALLALPNVTIVPVTDDAPRLWTRPGSGGAGRASCSGSAGILPGERSPDWLKIKQRHRLTVRVNRELSCLRRGFNLARRDGLLDTVPLFPMLEEDNVRTGFYEEHER